MHSRPVVIMWSRCNVRYLFTPKSRGGFSLQCPQGIPQQLQAQTQPPRSIWLRQLPHPPFL